MWIKVCGLTSGEAVAAALEAGVDAIGFVFSPSVRRLTATQALRLAGPARGRVACVAVTRHPDAALVAEILDVFAPDVLQTDVGDYATIDLAKRCAPLPVLRAGEAVPEPPPPRLLFEGPVSGSGRVADWAAARSLAVRAELVLAGGLGPANVGEAIRAVRPFGVDVSSGVESSPGIKCPRLISEFVRAARAAGLELEG